MTSQVLQTSSPVPLTARGFYLFAFVLFVFSNIRTKKENMQSQIKNCIVSCKINANASKYKCYLFIIVQNLTSGYGMPEEYVVLFLLTGKPTKFHSPLNTKLSTPPEAELFTTSSCSKTCNYMNCLLLEQRNICFCFNFKIPKFHYMSQRIGV